MKKVEDPDSNDDEMAEEYDFSKGERGKYAQRYREGTNIIVLSPDVAEVFPTSESVNEALRMLIRIINQNKHSLSE